MESLKNLREPAALVILVVLALRVLLALVTAVVYVGIDLAGGLPAAANLVSFRATDPLLCLVLAALVASCVLAGPPTRRARGLASVALVVVGVSVLVSLVFAVLGLATRSDLAPVNALDALTVLALPVLLVIALVRLRSAAPGGSRSSALAGARSSTAIASPTLPDPAFPRQVPGPPDEQYQPSWLPDTASGAAWNRAGDAAAGAPASGWGTPGQGGGWQVGPTTPAPSGPSVPTAGSSTPDSAVDQGGWGAPPPRAPDREPPHV